MSNITIVPQYVAIETINTCNARCPFCPLFQGEAPLSRPSHVMSEGLYSSIIDEVASWPELPGAIFLNMNGEPLQDPMFLSRLAILREHGLAELVDLQTNAHFLSEPIARAILQTGINRLVVGFDGATKAIYEAHRVRCNYDRVLANLRRFAAMRDATGAPTKIAIQYVRTKKNHHEVLDSYRMFSEFLNADKDVFQDNLSKDWGDTEYNRDLYFLPKRQHARSGTGSCPLFDSQLIINSDGKIAACCWDYNLSVSDGGLGVAGETQLLAVWHGRKRAHVAAAIAHDDPMHRPAKCRECIFSGDSPMLSAEDAKVADASRVSISPFGYTYQFERRA